MDIRFKGPSVLNPSSYMGWCKEASEIALEILHNEGYDYFKLGKCFVEEVDHWVVYTDVKYEGDNIYYSGVIDMTAIQFHNDPNLKQYISEFRKYSFGKVDDDHSKRYYKVKPEDL